MKCGGISDLTIELLKPRDKRKGFKRRRKHPFSISDKRINELYDNYFSGITNKHKSFRFKVESLDFNEIVYLLRVHFQLWIEIQGKSIMIFQEFPKRFRLTKAVNTDNHWFTPKTLVKGTVLYFGDDHYGVCNRMNGIPLAEEPQLKNSNKIRPVVQINYEFIESIRD